jgi:hypothetical protein
MMGHNNTLWRPSARVRSQIKHGEETFRRVGGATQGMTEKAAAAKSKARRLGEPHFTAHNEVGNDNRK